MLLPAVPLLVPRSLHPVAKAGLMLVGVAVVALIARSFARIHESNLKKQGLLPLVFRRAEDYERIREDDRLTLPDVLQVLAPGRDLRCEVRHSDGTREIIELGHTLSQAHVRWWRAGSALNALRQEQTARPHA